jgi:hypothetical protein
MIAKQWGKSLHAIYVIEAMTNTYLFEEVREHALLSTPSSPFALENILLSNLPILKQRPMTGAILRAVPFSLAF